MKQLDMRTLKIAVGNLDPTPKGARPKLLKDEDTLMVATAEMKCYDSQPQQTRRLASNLNSLIKTISETSNPKLKHDIR